MYISEVANKLFLLDQTTALQAAAKDDFNIFRAVVFRINLGYFAFAMIWNLSYSHKAKSNNCEQFLKDIEMFETHYTPRDAWKYSFKRKLGLRYQCHYSDSSTKAPLATKKTFILCILPGFLECTEHYKCFQEKLLFIYKFY